MRPLAHSVWHPMQQGIPGSHVQYCPDTIDTLQAKIFRVHFSEFTHVWIPLSSIGNTDNNNVDALGISKVDDNNKKWNKEEAEDMHARPYQGRRQWQHRRQQRRNCKAREISTGNEEACIEVVNLCVISLGNNTLCTICGNRRPNNQCHLWCVQ